MPEDILASLHKYVDPRIFNRGLDCYRNQLIESPERVSEHTWVAQALGRRVYTVSLTFNPYGKDEWHCDCPFDGPVCKHVVAACFAVLRVAAEIYPGVSQAGDLYKLPACVSDTTLDTLFEVIDKNELIGFFRRELKQNHQLAKVFESEFIYRLPEHQKLQRYRSIVSKEVRTAYSNQQFADYPDYRNYGDMEAMSNELIDNMGWLLDLSEKHREENRPEEVLIIAKAILEEVPVSLGKLVKEGVDYYELPDEDRLVELTVAELYKIAESGNRNLKNKLFDSVWVLFEDEKLHSGDVPNQLLRVMGRSAADPKRGERFLHLLDRLVDDFRNGEQSVIGEHQLQEIKIEYLQHLGREKEAVEEMMALKEDPKFGLMLARHYIGKKQFAEAKHFCAEALKNVESRREVSASLFADWSRPDTWYKLLYEIAQQETNTADMRTWLEKLMCVNYQPIKWFIEYKKTWSETEWVQAREKIIARQEHRNDEFFLDHFLADIYVEENMFDRLEQMLVAKAHNAHDFHSICRFALQMADKQPEGAGIVMQHAIGAYAAEHVGRKYYREIAIQLREVITWRGGREHARRIATRLIEEYPTRRAMKEELEQVFFSPFEIREL